MALGIVASVMGGLIAIIPAIGKVDINKSELISLLSVVTTVSFLMISFVFFFYRIRESQEETTYSSRSKSLREYLDFEKQVVEIIKNSGAQVSPASLRDHGYDFQISVGGKKILVEIKSMSQRLPTSIIDKILQKLSEAIDQSGADEGVLITKNPVEFPEERIEGKPVRILSLKEFRNYLSYGK